MGLLNENDVKSAFLPFLREFYRFRYEYNPLTVKSSLDNVSSDGYVADGLLMFQKQDGSTFTCTFEASSNETRDEVVFTKNQTHFLWDSLVCGLLLSTITLVTLYVNNATRLANLTLLSKWGLTLGLLIVGFFSWYFLATNRKKYRTIYAIEQFKRYYVDDQWIALAEDVFPAPTHPYYLELKDQCVYFGIGLAIVYRDQPVRLIVAPSNLKPIHKSKKMANWIADNSLYQALSLNAKAAAAYQTPLSKPLSKIGTLVSLFLILPFKKSLGNTMGISPNSLLKFYRSYNTHKLIVLLASFIIGAIYYYAENKKELIYSEKPTQIYTPEPTTNNSPEQQDGIVLNETEKPIPYGKTYPTGEKGLPKQDPQPAVSSLSDPNINSYQANTSPLDELCQHIKRSGGWYLQESKFSSAASANKRVAELQSKGIKADAFNSACLGEPGWIVRLDFNQYSDKIATFMAADYQRQIIAAGLKANKVVVKKVPI
jgi:uncharacterized integral membrane protein